MPGVVFKFMTLNRYKLKIIIGLKDIAKICQISKFCLNKSSNHIKKNPINLYLQTAPYWVAVIKNL